MVGSNWIWIDGKNSLIKRLANAKNRIWWGNETFSVGTGTGGATTGFDIKADGWCFNSFDLFFSETKKADSSSGCLDRFTGCCCCGFGLFELLFGTIGLMFLGLKLANECGLLDWLVLVRSVRGLVCVCGRSFGMLESIAMWYWGIGLLSFAFGFELDGTDVEANLIQSNHKWLTNTYALQSALEPESRLGWKAFVLENHLWYSVHVWKFYHYVDFLTVDQTDYWKISFDCLALLFQDPVYYYYCYCNEN